MKIFLDCFTGEVSTNRITAIQVLKKPLTFQQISQHIRRYTVEDMIFEDLQEAYQDMACALTEVDGINYTDPEELLVATLTDLDAIDGKGSVSLLAKCSSSLDVKT
ncbi:hypothetical protein Tco_1279937, partial [Tanacetum coccineum]